MGKKMLINALHAEEARVAIVEDGRLVDLDVEIAGSEQIRGNIYRGVVVRVEPGLQAAFVDVGLKKLGFLQMGEIHPEYHKWRDDIPEDQRHRRPRIQEVLRRGQELIVQVEKGERDNKGSALTTYVSLPGRYMVLMPGSDSAGISRKVENESERKKLKEIISEMTIPPGYGYIIRTEAMGRTREELQKDLDSLISLYEGVRSQGATMKGSGLIYQESALIIRTIRDYFSSDIDEVLVDSKDVFKDVREALKEIDPQFEKLVKMHQEKRPIFSRYQLEEQIDLIYEKKVPLKSGGSIFIEPTEALVSIDVNSGKSTGEKGVEDTAFKTNLEAAEEAARQLRLRDLGGLIVIDFIDMRDRKHNAEVEKTLKTALKADKARVNVARISEFGLLEMSRQRIRQTLNQASTLECPHCDGRGKVKSVEAMALSFLRKVHAAAAKGTIAEVVGSLPLEVAYYLLNRKRQELSRIESDYDIEVTVKGKPSYLLNQMELELVKREKLPQEELPQERPHVRPQAKEEAHPQEAAPAEGRKKRKRGKAKPPAEVEAAVSEIAALPEGAVHPEIPGKEAPYALTEGAVSGLVPASAALAEAELFPEGAEGVPIALVTEPGGAERVVTAEGEPEEQKKKRRRKRRRGKGLTAEAAAPGERHAGEPVEIAVDLPAAGTGTVPPEEAEGAEHEPEALAEHAGEEVKKKRRRKRRRGKGHEGAALEAAASVAMEQAGGVVAQETVMQAEEGVEAASAPQAEAAPAAGKPRSSRRRKKGAEPAGVEETAAEAQAPVSAAEAAGTEVVPAELAPPQPISPQGAPETPVAEAPAATEAPKAKRSRARRAAKETEAAPAAQTPATEPAAAPVAEPAAGPHFEPSPVPPTEPVPAEGAFEQPAAGPVAEAAPPAAKKARKPARAKGAAAVAPTGGGEAQPEAAFPAEPILAPVPGAGPLASAAPVPDTGAIAGEAVAAPEKRKARPKAKKAAKEEAGPAPATPAADQPKKPRAPRKKKEEAPE